MVMSKPERYDFIGLSTDTKPTPETSERVVNGSTYYTADDSKLYVFCDGEWYERQPIGGGGANVVQTTGTSPKDVMSQNAATSLVWGDPGTYKRINVGGGPSVGADNVTCMMGSATFSNNENSIVIGVPNSIANVYRNSPSSVCIGGVARVGTNAGGSVVIGYEAHSGNLSNTGGRFGVAIGQRAGCLGMQEAACAIGVESTANAVGSIALGARSTATQQGEMNIGTSLTSYGYNNSNYRLLTGLYDPQSAHDAATKGYVDAKITALEARVAELEGN